MDENKKSVLIVEDDESLLGVLKDVLSSEGYSVLTAGNGAKGLEIALAKHPSLILLDIIMPEMNGLEMLEKLRADDWGKTAEVVLLTNVEGQEQVAKAVEFGANEYLFKSDHAMDDILTMVKKKLS